MNYLNNRDIAIIFWITITIIILAIASIKNKIEVMPLISGITNKKIIIPFCIMISYITLMVIFLYKINLWDINQLKNTFFWTISFGILSFFNILKIKEDRNYFKKAIINNFKYIVILEFVINIYTLPIIPEIVLILVLFIINILLAIADKDKKYIRVKSFLELCLTFFGIALFIYTIYMISKDFKGIYNKNTLYDFFTPIILTLFYLPFIFMFLLYIAYEKIFINLHIFIKKKYLRLLAKIYVCIIFNVRRNLSDRWFEHIKIVKIYSHLNLIHSFKYILNTHKSKQKPKEISKDLGWSPYKAKYFLSAKNIQTFPYELQKNGKWWTSSKAQNAHNKQAINYITYYLDGNEHIVTTLTLAIYIKTDQDTLLFKKEFIEVSNILSIESLEIPLSNAMKDSILKQHSHKEIYNNKMVTLISNHWSNSNGYDLTITISIKP